MPWKHILSAGEKSVRVWHSIANLPFGAEFPHRAGESDDDKAHDGGVGFPVVRLAIPASGWRPDMLRVPEPISDLRSARR